MEDNEKKNENAVDIEQKTESANVDTNEENQSGSLVKNNEIIEPIPTAPHTNPEASINDETRPQPIHTSIEHAIEKDTDQQVPSSSTESSDQCSDERIEEKMYENNASPLNGANESANSLTIAANTTSESVLTNINESNNDDANDLASSSRLMEIESDCRTETKLNNKLDKSEIINELTTASIANCDSSEIIEDSMNVIHSNGSNNVSDSRGDNIEIVIADTVSCNENGANNCVEENTSNKDEESNSKLERLSTQCTTSPVACAIYSSSIVDSTDKNLIDNDEKINEKPSSSVEPEKILSQNDNTPSVHSHINDKGGGTDNETTNLQKSPANNIVLNNSLDSINSSIDTNDHKSEQPIDGHDKESNESSKSEICSSSRTEDKSGCDLKHSSIVENPVAYGGSVIRPTLIVANIKENDDSRRNDNPTSQSNSDRSSSIVHSESLPRIELPKSSLDTSLKKPTELKMKTTYERPTSNSLNENSSANLSLDLTQSSSIPSRERSSIPTRDSSSIASGEHSSIPSRENVSMPSRESYLTPSRESNSMPSRESNLMSSREINLMSSRENNSMPSRESSSMPSRENSSILSRQNSLYVSTPDFSRQKSSTEDLSSLRMKPPDFSKLTHAYSTNHLKIPNPNFNEMDAPLKQHQPTVNPANFAEISKRLNYISDLQLKTTTPSHTNSFDRPSDSNRNLSNLYVKAPDFSGQKKKSLHEPIDEPTAHVIHKNPYLNQSDKSNKTVQQPPSDPSIIYRNYPQISQDVTMSIVPTHPFSQQHPAHQQPLSQKQNTVEPPQPVDQRFKQNYPAEMHKGHPGHPNLYRPTAPGTQHLYENRVPDASYSSQTKAMNISYKHKADQPNSLNPYQRENTRAAVIQSGKPSSLPAEPETYNQKVQPNYVSRNDIQPGYYEKPVPKPIANQHVEYLHGQQHFSNSRYPPEFNDRITTNKSSYERPAYCEVMPGAYQEHYKQSMKHNTPNSTPMAAPSSRPLRSPIMHSKPIDIPSGHMNPPQYWPSHSPRITQSPISLSSSPLSGRVSQSPAGASPSPQHHVIHAPSALPAQSPTYRYNSPHQAQSPSPYNVATTASSPIQFKDSVNPSMFQKPTKSKSTKPTKTTVSQPNNPNYYYLPPESAPYPGHQYSMKVEPSAHYPPHQYSAKTDNNLRDDSRTKQTKNKAFPDYVDLTKTQKPPEIPASHMPMVGQENRYDHRYLNERHEMHQNHRPEAVPNKHPPESSRAMDKHVYNSQQKTIMDPYAYRKASEADLNYEIIKKTLNKDISIRRSDADLSCSIFDTPKLNQSKNVGYPTSNDQYYGRGSTYQQQPNFYHQQPTEARRDSKGVQILDGNRYYTGAPQQVAKSSSQEAEQASRAKIYENARPPNDLKKHDLSVTVSRISAAIGQPIERARLQHSETTIPITHQPSTSRLQATSQVASAKNNLPQTQPVAPQKPSSTMKSVLAPVKRESPLDLSVKTVKTKADSTGDDYAVPSSSREYNTPLSLKVDFAPNFQKHSRVPDKSTANHTQPRYENQTPMNSQYPATQRQPSHSTSQNVTPRSGEKLIDSRYHNQNLHQPHGPSAYIQSQVPIAAPSTQIRSQITNDPFKHQSKPLVLSPTVPTVFGRKPEELKNLPINPEIQEYKSTANTIPIGSYENNQNRMKNQGKPPEHLIPSHHSNKPLEIPAKFSDFKTKIDSMQIKTIQTPVTAPVEPSKDRTPYGFPGERPPYMAQYQEQRQPNIPNQSNRSLEEMPSGHYDPYYSRKRPAEPQSLDQFPKVKQMRRDEPPSQHAHYYNMDKRYHPLADPKGHERYEIPPDKMDYPKFIPPTYQREEPKYSSIERIPPVDEAREAINNPIAPTIRDNMPPNYAKNPYHLYPEQMYNHSENRAATHEPVISYPTEQHQKHLAYQKSKKEAYKQLPSPPPNQHNYYQRDSKHQTHENYNAYPPFKPEAKSYYETNFGPNHQYPKQDTNPPPQQVYQQWPPNQATIPPDSSKSYYPPNESTTSRNYRDYNQPAAHPVQPPEVRPNHRVNPSEGSSRQQTTLKGADQNVISKLRTNLEMKEIEKQKLLRNQSSTETVDDENQKSDIASLIAARIRTKGELKGFTPITLVEPKVDVPSNRTDEITIDVPVINTVRDVSSEGDNGSAFDLLDWGSACNDFVEQLQGAGNKKRGRRRRGKSSLIDTEFETVGQEIPLKNLPGVDYKCDINEDLVNIVKAENKTHQPLEESVNQSTKKGDDSSSDEDKPLLFLRQKSLNEMGKLKATQDDDAINESSTVSDSTKQGQSSDKKTVSAKLSEKIAKNKKGQQREKRENEKRISIASSSESEDEISSKIKRPKKTVRKPRTRSSVGYKNSSDDETSENGSKNSKRKNDHTKRKKSSKSSSDSEPLKQRKKVPKIDSDESGDESEVVKVVHIKQEIISDDEESDAKTETIKTSIKKEPGVINVKIEETMTRSKRKQELERQKANSKILRNDKMVKNVSISDRKSIDPKKEKNSPKSKSKGISSKDDGKRKSDDTDNGESSKNDSTKKKSTRIASVQSISSDSEEPEVDRSLRRRTRSAKSIDQRTPEKSKNSVDKVVEKKWSRNSPQKKNTKESPNKPPIEQFPPGWENDVYAFKRSLKIPASLITIKRPAWYRKSISLPDLDPHSSDTSETFSEKKQLFLKPLSELSDRKVGKKDAKNCRPVNSMVVNEKVAIAVLEKRPDDLPSKSIIDLLHQKIIHPISKQSKKARLLHSNEPKILPQSNEIELLSTPGAENVFKHQSVFETAVLKSRTRKEYRVQKNQEIIREVFGCDDRPASAPPLHALLDKAPAITFDQKYKQYLEKMNVDFSDSKLVKSEITPDVSIVKQEKIDEDSLLNDDETQDTEINDCERNALDIKDEPLDSNERDTPSVSEREGITPSSFSLIRKRGRGARGGRRKGSSGFDYIRKKKKPTQQGIDGAPSHQKRRSAAINYLQEKDENDINREIRGWVLNKGVGETVLHKGARLGYIDVIAFCLERLEMNPDQKDNAGYTALHEACSRGHLDIARLLLEYGANHSETAVLGGIRPLHEAVENGYIEIVRLLLSYGADPLLATYSGQTPIMLAESDDQMIAFLKNYLHDIQNTGPNKMPWRFEGSWKKYDADEYGYDLFDGVPFDENDSTKADKSINASKPESNPTALNNVDAAKTIKINKCDSNSNIMLMKTNARKRPITIPSPENHRSIKSKYKNLSPCTVVLTNLTDKNNTIANGTNKAETPPLSNQMPDVASEPPEIIEFSDDDSDADFFEIEESQAPHVPLYHLRDEGPVKWALLSDLCYMLKVKSKDTLLKQICSSSPPTSASNKELLRELKMGDFLERATCLQLLCAGEKLNIRSSKVVLVKYNDSVKNLLGVKTVLMKM